MKCKMNNKGSDLLLQMYDIHCQLLSNYIRWKTKTAIEICLLVFSGWYFLDVFLTVARFQTVLSFCVGCCRWIKHTV